MEQKRAQKSLFPPASYRRAFGAGFLDGISAPLRIFSMFFAVEAPLTREPGDFSSARRASIKVSKYLRAGFEAAEIDVARKLQKRA